MKYPKVGSKFEHKEWIDASGAKVVCEVTEPDFDKERIYFRVLSNMQLYWVRAYWFRNETYGKRIKS